MSSPAVPRRLRAYQKVATRKLRALLNIGHVIAYHVPRHLPAKVSRRLVVRANAARDAGLYEVAAVLFQEASRYTPKNARIHIQCGHMFKEQRDYASAEHHYRAAELLAPGSPDLALQLGHFFKVSGRPEEAEAAYTRALMLRPGWTEAAEELAHMRSGVETDASLSAAGSEAFEKIIPELLPRASEQSKHHREAIRVLRLGSHRIRSQWGMLKALRGVEAIRGYCVSSTPIKTLRIAVDGTSVCSAPLRRYPVDGPRGIWNKYVFNIWYDFSGLPAGRSEVTLEFVDEHGRSRFHREYVLLAPSVGNDAQLDSDALVPQLGEDGYRSLEAQINGLPSNVRRAVRTPLPGKLSSILVQRVDQLGDLVCSVPAVLRLRELFPDAQVVGLLTTANADLGRSLGIFDEIVVADFADYSPGGRRGMSAENQIQLRGMLSKHNFDLAIDLGETSDSRPLLLLSGAKFLYGFKGRDWPWLSAAFEMSARDQINGLETIPPSRKLLALIEALGSISTSAARPLRRADLRLEDLAIYGVPQERPFVVLHTGARLKHSRWPGFSNLAKLLLEQTNVSVVVLVDDASELHQFERSDRLHMIAGRMEFDHFDALLSLCSVFVGNDSGPKHLAALRGTKVVSLHMARLNWNEWGQEISGTIISRAVPCAGCAISHDGEECGQDYACIRYIAPEEVFLAVINLMESEERSPSIA